MDGLIDNSELQLSFFDTKDKQKEQKLDKTIDEIKKKYGYNVITRGK